MKVKMEQANELLVDDLESLLRDIADFTAGSGNNKPEEIPITLENYLLFVAKTGNTVFPWQHIRCLFRLKMLSAINQFGGESSTTEAFVLERFDMFRAAPFTIQRFTELITQPSRHYKKKEKFLRGLEKTVLVVSTVEPKAIHENDVKNGNDNNSNSSMDGVDGDADQGFSEGDDQPVNRTFLLDQQHDDIVTSAGVSGEIDVTVTHKSGSADIDNVSSTNLAAGSSAIAVVSTEIVESLQVTGIDTPKMLQTNRSKTVEVCRTFIGINPESSVGAVEGITDIEIPPQIILESESSSIIGVSPAAETPQEPPMTPVEPGIEFATHQQRVTLVSSEQDFNLVKTVNMEVNTVIDVNGNPPVPVVETKDVPVDCVDEQNSSTPMDVDEDESAATSFSTEDRPIDTEAPTLQDISNAAPPVSVSDPEKDTSISTDEGIPPCLFNIEERPLETESPTLQDISSAAVSDCDTEAIISTDEISNDGIPESLYNIENGPTESEIPTLQDISNAAPPASVSDSEKDTNDSTDEGVPVSTVFSSTSETVISNEEVVAEFVSSTAIVEDTGHQ